MRSPTKFVPSIEACEHLILMATYTNPAVFGNFYSPVVLDDSDPTGHSAFAFPGMTFSLQIVLPPGYYSIKKIYFTPSTSIVEIGPGSSTQYTTSVGNYSTVGTTSFTYPNFIKLEDHPTIGDIPMFPGAGGTETITIDEEAWIKTGPEWPTTYDDLITTVTFKVENPTVNSFTIADVSSSATPAPPLWFGLVDSNKNPATSGSNPGFLMASGTPPAKGKIMMWSNVTNNTHYALDMGYIQLIDITRSASYTDGTFKHSSGTSLFDSPKGQSSLWYLQYNIYVESGSTTNIPMSPGTLAQPPSDSPMFAPLAYVENLLSWGYLQSIRFHYQFQTSLAVQGGWLPGGHPGIDGIPIAMSTAQWHMDGSADNTANILNPGSASTASTTAIANWVANMAIGAGPSPTSLPGTNVAWTAAGDGIPKYLTWNGNVDDNRSAYNSSTYSPNTTDYFDTYDNHYNVNNVSIVQFDPIFDLTMFANGSSWASSFNGSTYATLKARLLSQRSKGTRGIPDPAVLQALDHVLTDY